MISFLLIALLAIVSTEHPFLLYMIAPTCAILYLFESSLRKKILVYGAFFIGVIFYTWMRQPSIDDARIIKDTGVVTEITQYSDGYKIVVQTNLFSKYAFYREKTILERGDLVSFLGTMKPFATPSMPHMVDQRIYQASKGITGVIHIESLEKKGEVFWKALYQFREHLASIYDRHLSSEASLLSKALTLR
ncbi:MAG: hypothetical protein Q4Q17_05045, partial [Tissierellia bacterium]|nr:hypothetical protein [Tissierellia bacterium]